MDGGHRWRARGEVDGSDALAKFEVVDEPGIVGLRLRARSLAARLGFEARGQVEITSALSMVARDILRAVGCCDVEVRLDGASPRALVFQFMARGPGPLGSPALFGDGYRARVLMDSLRAEESDHLAVSMGKRLPPQAPAFSPPDLARIAGELAGLGVDPASPVDELIRQDGEFIQAHDDCEAQTRKLTELNRELEETSRAVLALDLELDERAESLRQAGEMKRRFLSKVSHELRTPLASILSLTRLLMDRADGDLSVEQERQVTFIARAAGDLSSMINDLIDLARIDAGREVIRPSDVHLPEFFAVLRGIFRPLQPPGSPITLSFEAPDDLPSLWTDPSKLLQILHNFLTNALKFTERGEVRVWAELAAGNRVVISVSDPGIGIEPDHLERVFEEFGQVDSPLQRIAKGTGLGLPLASKLARLLGGRVDVRSEPGVGSTFTATIPIRFQAEAEPTA